MKKINRDGIRALILETLEEIALEEAKDKEEVKEAIPTAVPGKDDVGTGSSSSDPDVGDDMMNAMSSTELQKEKAKIDKAFEFYEQDPGDATLPLVITTLEASLKYLKSLEPKPAGQAN